MGWHVISNVVLTNITRDGTLEGLMILFNGFDNQFSINSFEGRSDDDFISNMKAASQDSSTNNQSQSFLEENLVDGQSQWNIEVSGGFRNAGQHFP